MNRFSYWLFLLAVLACSHLVTPLAGQCCLGAQDQSVLSSNGRFRVVATSLAGTGPQHHGPYDFRFTMYRVAELARDAEPAPKDIELGTFVRHHVVVTLAQAIDQEVPVGIRRDVVEFAVARLHRSDGLWPRVGRLPRSALRVALAVPALLRALANLPKGEHRRYAAQSLLDALVVHAAKVPAEDLENFCSGLNEGVSMVLASTDPAAHWKFLLALYRDNDQRGRFSRWLAAGNLLARNRDREFARFLF